MNNYSNTSNFMKKQKKIKSNLYDVFLCAAIKGDIKLMKKCMERNVDVSYQNNMAVKLAAQKGCTDMVNFLLSSGADKDVAFQYGTNEIKESIKKNDIQHMNICKPY